MKENGAIFARIVNELYEVLCEATGNVGNIDKTNPMVTIELSSKITEELSSIQATVEQTDKESGIDIEKCKWTYNTISHNIGTNEEDYTGGTFQENKEELTLKGTIAGTYYLHVLSVDHAGNKEEFKSEAITVEKVPTIEDVTANEYINYILPNGTTIKCAVLWDSNSIYGKDGVQIVAMNPIEQVTIGEGTRLGSNGRGI